MKDLWKVKFQQTGKEELLHLDHNRIGNEITIHRLVIGNDLYCERTEALVYYYSPMNGSSKICYLDFTSLYPWVQKSQKFQGGTPEKFVGEQISKIDGYIEEMEIKYFGVAYICVLPPQVLNILVLSCRYDIQLMFPLCRTCTKEGMDSQCAHTESERWDF